MGGAIKSTQAILTIARKFIRSPIYKTVTFIMLWKLVAKVSRWYLRVGDIVKLCVEYVRENVGGDKEKEILTRFTKYIRFVEFLH